MRAKSLRLAFGPARSCLERYCRVWCLGQASWFIARMNLWAVRAACFRKAFAPYAVLMYVVVLDEYRRLGLGAACTHEVIEAARSAGYPGIILHTDARRLAAIKLYLRLGFVPDGVEIRRSRHCGKRFCLKFAAIPSREI